MTREASRSAIVNNNRTIDLGLTSGMIFNAINHTYNILDAIDSKLVESGSERLALLLELANLSAIVGNLFRGGISISSNDLFIPNKPHTYPDLLSTNPNYDGIEIKVALEKNKPKGHLIKPGPHLTIRYVLGNDDGTYYLGKKKRGDVVWIWEVRMGILGENHFNFSNTEGDSGKTAVINAEGMANLPVVFCDLERCPYSKSGPIYKDYKMLCCPAK